MHIGDLAHAWQEHPHSSDACMIKSKLGFQEDKGKSSGEIFLDWPWSDSVHIPVANAIALVTYLRHAFRPHSHVDAGQGRPILKTCAFSCFLNRLLQVSLEYLATRRHVCVVRGSCRVAAGSAACDAR
jgi:hypothetical protein